MDSIEALFQGFGGPAKVGQAIGVSTEHAAAMKRRGSVPVDYWPALISAAQTREVEGVTYKSLTLMHARRPAHQEQAGVA